MTFGMKYWSGVRNAAGQDEQPDEPQRLGRVAPVEAGRSTSPTNGRTQQHADAADGAEHAPLEGVDAVVVLHEEVRAAPATVNSPKPSAANATSTVLSVRICHEPGERGLDRDRRRLRVLDDLAEHVLLLELAAGRLRACGTRGARAIATGMPSRKNAQRQPSSPPASAAMPATTTGLSTPTKRPPMRQPRVDAPADADRVGVGDQRPVHRAACSTSRCRRRAGPRTA